MASRNVSVKIVVFVINPNHKTVSDETKKLIDLLLLERISLRDIARVTGVSWSWLQNYVNNKFSQVPRQVKVTEKPKGKLIIEFDELWSFVFWALRYLLWLDREHKSTKSLSGKEFN